MREVDALIDRDPLATPPTHRRAGEVAKAVDRNAGRFFKPRNEKGRSEMREVMFDMVDLAP